MNLEQRFKNIIADPRNKKIPRVSNAGQIINNYYVMHNGLLTLPYYGNFSKILELNGGVHEPSEEYVFSEILKRVPNCGNMIELGSYWAFYSMWFCQRVKNANVICVEPNITRLNVGKYNFELNLSQLNNPNVTLINEKIDNFYNLNNIIKRWNIVDIVHADIQGNEVELLNNSIDILLNNLIRYLFISTHSQQKHIECLNILKNNKYEIIASADLNETYCCDGIILAQSNSEPYDIIFDLGSRTLGT